LPLHDSVAQLLSSFGLFALGYLVRPIGGALIGYIGDYYGRRSALTVFVTAMDAKGRSCRIGVRLGPSDELIE
jgi:MFS family permease